MTNLSGANLNNGIDVGPQGEGRDSPSSFPAYSAYKDSGVEWQGAVPADWPRSALKYLADYQNGYPFKPEDWSEKGLPIIRISQLTGDTEPNYYSGELDDRIKVNDGDLLFSWSATIDSFIWAGGTAWLNQHIFKVSLTEEADQQFLFYLIKLVAPKLADFDAHGSTMRHIKKESLSERLHVPTLKEQTQIARFLDHETARIDALIEEQQRLIELLKEKRQAVISHAVTKGLDPTVPMKDSGVEWLGEVPVHWSVVPFGLAFGYQEGPGIMAVDFRDEGVPLVRISGVQGRWVTLQGCNYLDPAKASGKWGHFRLEHGDLIISGSASMGLVSEVGEEAVGAVAYTGLIRLTPKTGISDRDFIRSVVGSYQFFVQIDLLKAGSTIQHFGPTHLSQMKVVLPPLDEQIKLASYVDKVSVQFDQLLGEAEKTNELLQERRSALISAAVTGKIDVRGWQPPASAPTPELAQEAV